ncbi:MAG: sensor histidine kinase [Ilumatobacter sp.]
MSDTAQLASAPDPSRLIGQFITIDRIGAVAGITLVVVVNGFVVREPGVWGTLPFLLLLIAALGVADRILRSDNVVASLVAIAAGNWVVAIAIAALLPFMWPVMVLTAIMPLLLATPHLAPRPLVWMTAAGALVGGLVAIIGLLSDDGGVLPDIDDVAELTLVVASLVAHTVPMALIVWHQKQIQAAALSAAEFLNDELRASEHALAASRRRVVEASDTERSRIERDLHDGAQQRLVAVRLQLELLAETESGPDGERLGRLADELQDALGELRDLARGIYPPVLQTGGVTEALAEVVRRSASTIELDAGSIGRYDPSIETALYFTALEALSNASKHAPDATVTIRLTETGAPGQTHVVLEITDDGPGYDLRTPTHTRGVLNMSDRVRAVDGEFTIDTEPGAGVRVTASVPVTQH